MESTRPPGLLLTDGPLRPGQQGIFRFLEVKLPSQHEPLSGEKKQSSIPYRPNKQPQHEPLSGEKKQSSLSRLGGGRLAAPVTASLRDRPSPYGIGHCGTTRIWLGIFRGALPASSFIIKKRAAEGQPVRSWPARPFPRPLKFKGRVCARAPFPDTVICRSPQFPPTRFFQIARDPESKSARRKAIQPGCAGSRPPGLLPPSPRTLFLFPFATLSLTAIQTQPTVSFLPSLHTMHIKSSSSPFPSLSLLSLAFTSPPRFPVDSPPPGSLPRTFYRVYQHFNPPWIPYWNIIQSHLFRRLLKWRKRRFQ
ncbi:hypothetical protein ES705_39812 [subsurface metagenome]